MIRTFCVLIAMLFLAIACAADDSSSQEIGEETVIDDSLEATGEDFEGGGEYAALLAVDVDEDGPQSRLPWIGVGE